jgi:antitoxin component of MazEF toxin-antitoxin module
MLRMKIRKFGSSLGFAFPRQAAARLKLRAGDTVWLTEHPSGGYLLMTGGAGFDGKME